MHQCNFGRHPRSDTRRCVQGDRFPYSVSALGRHLVLQTKLASSLSTVHFKAVFTSISGHEPKVVQKSTTKGNFLVDDCAANALNSEAPEDISPKTVVAEELGRSRLEKMHWEVTN